MSEFKARCLSLFDEIEQRKIAGLIVTRHGKDVATISPVPAPKVDLWGAHRGSVTFVEGVDLTEPTTTEPTDAELGILHR